MTAGLAFLLLWAPQDPGLRPVEELGLRAAPGFKVTLYSGPDLANDLYAMTLDSRGRPVVTSQGWIRLLHDDDGDGRADRTSAFAPTRTGGMGLCFEGNDLYFSGDNGVWRYRDADGNGEADGPPVRLLKLSFGEHGGHAVRKGPDGSWYVIGGNDAQIGPEHASSPRSPISQPETGGLLRATPDWSRLEVIAHGFRNPYDFDFNEHGDLFTYDSDCERDFFLPWYTPTRLYHVGYGLHHGWRLKGYLRSYCRRDFYPDVVDVLWPVGRGSPTGVTVYRHAAFPERYRGGVFYADWTFGKIFFTPLVPAGASYAPKAEVFLEPAGSEGFAPTDLCVAPDGALLVSIGGRRTRGAVYRIQAENPPAPAEPRDDLERVLRAPQPLDAWSRAAWEPVARKLGPRPFEEAILKAQGSLQDRLRAVEILTDLFEGVPERLARESPALNGGPLRARIAWSLGRKPGPGAEEALLRMAAEAPVRTPADAAAVRRNALEALGDLPSLPRGEWIASVVTANLGYPDKRVRQAAARLAARLPADAWKELTAAARRAGPQTRVQAVLAGIWRGTPPLEELEEAFPLLEAPDLRLQAVRLFILALGDSNLHKPPTETHSDYSLPAVPAPETRERLLRAVRPLYPSGDPPLDLELSRLLAMLEDDDPSSVEKTAAFLDEKSPATRDVHYLIVLSRLKGAWPDSLPGRLAHALLSLGRKLEGQEQRTKLVWGPRLAELTALFARREPRFVSELLQHPALAAPGHVEIAAALPGEGRSEAARLFLEAARRDASFAWSEPLMGLLAGRAPEEFHPVLRGQWSNFALRDSIVVHLASKPDPQDREKFLAGVESAHAQASRAALEALEKLPPDASPATLAPLLRLLRRLTLEPKQGPARTRVAALLARQTGTSFPVKEENTDPQALRQAYHPVFDSLLAAHPSLKAELEGSEDPAALRELLKTVPWDRGDVARGLEIFRARGCQTCHAVQGALGPNLAGAASRFSRDDLFEAVANPGKDVAPLYRTTVFLTKDGQVHTGIVAFESADGYIVQTGATTTVRVNAPDIAQMKPGASSIMPNDLLKGLKPEEIADLYAYLRGLK